MKSMSSNKFSNKDWLLAAFLFLLVLFLSACSLETGLANWGDDHSAYISEGIAIAEGRFDEQTKINYYYHPSALPAEAEDNTLIYAWGYPLHLAVIYMLVGFDRVQYSSIIYYKIPTLLCFALTAGVLYLLFRRRFPRSFAFCGALLFCLSNYMIGLINYLYSDVVFLFYSTLTLLLAECYAERVLDQKPAYGLAFLYSLSLLFTYATRLNGPAVCLIALLAHIIILWRNRKKCKPNLWRHGIPYLAFALLAILIEHFWLAPATGNTSDIVGTRFWNNLSYYKTLLLDFFGDFYGRHVYFGYALALFAVLGLVTSGFRENLHLSLMLVGTMAVLLMLPYRQGIRYMINILPFMIMYALYGLSFVLQKLTQDKLSEKARGVLALIISLLIVAYPLMTQSLRSLDRLKNRDAIGVNDVYSSDAVEIYRYIQNYTPEDAVICFCKPRSLYLNTERLSFRVNWNGHELREADYYLLNKRDDWDSNLVEKTDVPLELVKENDGFALYRIREN